MEGFDRECPKLFTMDFQAQPDALVEAALTFDLFSLDAIIISTKLAAYEFRPALSRQL